MSTDRSLTTCPEAAAEYRRGIEQLHADDRRAASEAFERAVAHDPGFALGHAALAAATAEASERDAALAHARTATRRISRPERQQISVIELVLTGRLPRGSALGREHLNEFPDDALIRHVLARHGQDVEDLVR